MSLDAALSGSLPCVVCGYELKGLSIRSMCPECGTAVRATILYNVDPKAEEFQPLLTPRFTSWCLVGLPVSALVAALAAWGMRLDDTAAALTGVSGGRNAAVWGTPFVLAGCIGASVSLTGLVRPVRVSPAWKSLAALGALVCMVPLTWTAWMILGIDRVSPAPYFGPYPDPNRVVLRLMQTMLLALVLAGFRPNARDLVKRSLAMRTKRVDRQTVLGMILVTGLIMLGDAARWWGGTGDMPQVLAVGTLAVAVGNLFLVLGMASATADGWRIGHAIRSPAPGLRQVVGG